MSPNAKVIGPGCTAVKTSTILERCVDQRQENQQVVNRISNRLVNMLERLRGAGPGTEGEGRPCADGMLYGHLYALETQGEDLGRIEADLEELERLL